MVKMEKGFAKEHRTFVLASEPGRLQQAQQDAPDKTGSCWTDVRHGYERPGEPITGRDAQSFELYLSWRAPQVARELADQSLNGHRSSHSLPLVAVDFY
jgi:hypothetical protein